MGAGNSYQLKEYSNSLDDPNKTPLRRKKSHSFAVFGSPPQSLPVLVKSSSMNARTKPHYDLSQFRSRAPSPIMTLQDDDLLFPMSPENEMKPPTPLSGKKSYLSPLAPRSGRHLSFQESPTGSSIGESSLDEFTFGAQTPIRSRENFDDAANIPSSLPENSRLAHLRRNHVHYKTPVNQQLRSRNRRSNSVCNILRRQINETTEINRGVDNKGRKTINQYAILKIVGQGSHSKVNLCVNVNTGQHYAIKEINKSLKSIRKADSVRKSYDRIRREVAIVKKLNHKNIVKVYEVIDDPSDGKLYIVFEYIEGGQLLHLDDKGVSNQIFSEDIARHYFEHLLSGVEYLHRNNVLHRDIKPENLLLEKSSDALMLSDFGVSQLFEGDNDILEDTQGTPAFQPPESCDAARRVYGRAADVWACGICLYIMVFGRVPFRGEGSGYGNLISLYSKIKFEEVAIPDYATEDLRDLLLKLLNKNGKERITIDQIKKHPWILHGREYIATPPQQIVMPPKISEEDIEASISIQNNFRLLDKVFWLQKKIKNTLTASPKQGMSPKSPVGSLKRTFLPPLIKHSGEGVVQ